MRDSCGLFRNDGFIHHNLNSYCFALWPVTDSIHSTGPSLTTNLYQHCTQPGRRCTISMAYQNYKPCEKDCITCAVVHCIPRVKPTQINWCNIDGTRKIWHTPQTYLNNLVNKGHNYIVTWVFRHYGCEAFSWACGENLSILKFSISSSSRIVSYKIATDSNWLSLQQYSR